MSETKLVTFFDFQELFKSYPTTRPSQLVEFLCEPHDCFFPMGTNLCIYFSQLDMNGWFVW